MKVIIYLDKEYSTVEVKDKIKSVLPDANYMIFDPTKNIGKVTEFDRIKNMNVQEMAEFICSIYDDNADKNIEGYTTLDYDEYRIKQWLETEAEE